MFRVCGLRRGTGVGARALHMSGAEVRSAFLDYFTERGHVPVRSSSVVPLCDPSVPFVNAGMNQFKGIFLGRHSAPHPRVVNSQKCIRVGGKHNDLGAVGADGTHHTLFEMLGNWSFGDYYKEEACRMAWELLTGPYRLKPEELLVTYFAGSQTLGLDEDRETRDIWRKIGVQSNAIRPLGMADNFWEMGATGPCGPCTELHHLAPDGTATEIWNLVFIQYNREGEGSIRSLPKRHVDTGMGLERATALLQGVPSNYDTDLFLPIIRAIEKESKQVGGGYRGKFGRTAALDCAYRCLADHARMVAVCLADGMFPVTSLNLKQIMRRCFKLSEDIFHCKSGLVSELYVHVADILGPTYPELFAKMADAKRIIEHEEQSYAKLRSNLAKKWKELALNYPEVESLADVELSGFAEGYKQFKQAMTGVSGATIPGDVVFKLYDAHGFTEEVIERVAQLNHCHVDRDGFEQLLKRHRSRHKTSLKEQFESNKTHKFDLAIEHLHKNGLTLTNDRPKYDYKMENGGSIIFPRLNSNLEAILNANGEWMESTEINSKEDFYLVTKDTNFYCEEGGQVADNGKINFSNAQFEVASVFKIRDVVFHKGVFVNDLTEQVKLGDSVTLEVNVDRRLSCMRNHTATHLLNAAIKRALPNSVTCQVGSSVTENGLVFNLAVYGQKLSQTVILEAQSLVRRTIGLDAQVETALVDSVQLSRLQDVVTVPGETYPDTGLRLVQLTSQHLTSRELCCGTHVPSTRHIGEFCITSVKSAGGHAPVIRALTGDAAKEVHQLTEKARELQQRALGTEARRLAAEAEGVRARLARLCDAEGAPHGEHARCLELLQALDRQVHERDKMSLNAVAEIEMRNMALEADALGRPFIVHFLMCSYLMESASLVTAIEPCRHKPTMVFGCANGIIKVACTLPKNCVTKDFTAEKWMTCVLPIFKSKIIAPSKTENLETFAAMTGTRVSLINCEALVHDAMKAAIAYADVHTRARGDPAPAPPAPAPRAQQYDSIACGDGHEEAGRGHS